MLYIGDWIRHLKDGVASALSPKFQHIGRSPISHPLPWQNFKHPTKLCDFEGVKKKGPSIPCVVVSQGSIENLKSEDLLCFKQSEIC
jgi:hypothetical protein